MNVIKVFVIVTCVINVGCSQNFGPGYSFSLFKNTPNWSLAQAVEKEDSNQIKKFIKEQNSNINLQEPKFGSTLLLLAIGNDKLISTKTLLEQGADLNIADSQHYTPIHEATKLINLRINSLEILKLLIKYGADVNSILFQKRGYTMN